jgi:hypothetical protein
MLISALGIGINSLAQRLDRNANIHQCIANGVTK